MKQIGYGSERLGLDAVFSALADPTRRAILSRLASGEASVNEIAAPFQISQPAVSKHLNVLEQAGLLRRSARGRERICALEPGALEDAHDWLAYYERYWNERLGALESLLEEAKPETGGG